MLAVLAKMLGVAPRLAEDALYSERAARAVLTRRSLFSAAGAMAAGSLLAKVPIGMPLVLRGWDRGEIFTEPVSIAEGALIDACVIVQGIVSGLGSFVLSNSYVVQHSGPLVINYRAEHGGSGLVGNIFEGPPSKLNLWHGPVVVG